MYAKKIFTEHGMAKDVLIPEGVVIHLGCGRSKLSGAVGVDVLALPGVDVVHDLDQYPWPFPDNGADLVFAHNVFEHVGDPVRFLNEVSRVCKRGGRMVIGVPYFRSIDAFTDPTHKHFFTSQSMEYFVGGESTLAQYGYSKSVFKKIGFWYGWPHPSRSFVARAFKRFIHRHPFFYDQYLSLLFPVKMLVWELEVVKEKK